MEIKIDKEAEELLQQKVPVGSLFEHYSGKKYKILAVARHSEDLQLYVVYQALYSHPVMGEHAIWVRPLKMFLENVNRDGTQLPRFKRMAEYS